MYFRENLEKSNLFFDWIEKNTEKYKIYNPKNKIEHNNINNKIMEFAEFISNDPVKNNISDKYIIDNYNEQLKNFM